MANPNVLNALAQGGAPATDSFSAAAVRGEQIRNSQQQRQQNALSQQYVQQDRSREDEMRQKAQLDSDVMNAYAPIAMQKDEGAAAQMWAQGASQLKQKYPGLQIPDQYPGKQAAFQMAAPHMPQELRNKMLEQEFGQQKPLEVSPGASLYDQQKGRAIYTAPNKPDTTASRLVPIPDANSPTGYSYGLPVQGQSAAPPRNAASSRLPPQIQKDEDADLEAINTASNIKADLGSLAAQIQGGGLELGPVSNAVGGVRNWAGASNENSRNLASFKSTLEKLRNDSLRLNKGVQTEGDAVRAWNELLSNVNDTGLVLQRLDEIQRINDRAASMRQALIENRRKSYGSQVPDTQPFENSAPAVGANKGGAAPAATGGGLPAGWTVTAH